MTDPTVSTEAVAPDRAFTSFFADEGERLRRALVAAYGPEIGVEVTNDALTWAWEHWDRVQQMESPVGYLYRVGQSAARRHHRWERPVSWPEERLGRDGGGADDGDGGPALDGAMARLSPNQRVAVLLVHGHGYSYAEAAEITGVSVGSVRNDLHRAMTRLRGELEPA